MHLLYALVLAAHRNPQDLVATAVEGVEEVVDKHDAVALLESCGEGGREVACPTLFYLYVTFILLVLFKLFF